jgi:hypothetical protein
VRSILIVANLTLCGPHLLEAVDERTSAGPCRFRVLVPASHGHKGSWTADESRGAAAERLETMLTALRERGCEADGEIGDISAVDATLDVLRETEVDEIIVSTLPPSASRWLRMDLVSRLERAVDVPVTHVVAEGADH